MASKSLEVLLSINTIGTVVLGILSTVLCFKSHNNNKRVNLVEQTCKEIKTDLQNIKGNSPIVVYPGETEDEFKPANRLRKSYSSATLPTINDYGNMQTPNSQSTNKSRSNMPCPCPTGIRKIRPSNSLASLPAVYMFDDNFKVEGENAEHSDTDMYAVKRVRSDEDLLQ